MVYLPLEETHALRPRESSWSEPGSWGPDVVKRVQGPNIPPGFVRGRNRVYESVNENVGDGDSGTQEDPSFPPPSSFHIPGWIVGSGTEEVPGGLFSYDCSVGVGGRKGDSVRDEMRGRGGRTLEELLSPEENECLYEERWVI